MMNSRLLQVFNQEVSAFKQASALGDSQKAILSLGRAHIISQASWIRHLQVHFLMLFFALRYSDGKEIFGQLIRLVVTVPGHISGKVPKGNIGWSTVSLTAESELPEDLKKLIHDY